MKNLRNLIFILIILITGEANGKKLDSLSFTNHKEFFLRWDNDMFVFKDYYYTQGAHFYLINPGLRKNPLNHLLFRLKNADNYYGLGIIQEIYTPKDVVDTLLNQVDRPYAGTLYVRSLISSAIPDKNIRLTSQLDLGFLGPLAGAGQAQRIVHEWLGLPWPQGWDFQIENRPYINYNLLLEKGLIQFQGIADFTGTTRLRLGNIHDDIQLNGYFRFGRINNLFKGYKLSNKNYKENRDYQWYIFGGAKVTAVAYNATLMGGLIPPDSHRIFTFNEIEKVVGEFYGGMEMSYRFVGMRGELTWKTPEFETGEHHGWGTIYFYFRF